MIKTGEYKSHLNTNSQGEGAWVLGVKRRRNQVCRGRHSLSQVEVTKKVRCVPWHIIERRKPMAKKSLKVKQAREQKYKTREYNRCKLC